MDNTTVTCYICGSGFDTDEFQVLQPGFELTWKSNLEEQKGKNLPPQGTVAPSALPAPQGAVAPCLGRCSRWDEVMAEICSREVRRTKYMMAMYRIQSFCGDGKMRVRRIAAPCSVDTDARLFFIHWINRFPCFSFLFCLITPINGN
jgi:hypothetical protein